ncbi:hypothetical protein ANACAC_03279 [Anaerostipes caccae L1-92]|uniref:Uncharacterized protein n=1 Tax=Anaerostipes caccae (strain DSM 14662 / CCUG 47493 / JCM 13470 / NCIMB 13811 / L1-92) TaxID=411490 RepID=B0MI52_ANACD|nr:hypothetical protein ANACAC_03279 [Anaerostipes caccae L1-92]
MGNLPYTGGYSWKLLLILHKRTESHDSLVKSPDSIGWSRV